MTERQEHIVREIGLELTRAKAKCKEPTQLLIPMLELGVHNTRYRGGK